MIKDRVLKLERIDWRNIKDLQPKDLKIVINDDEIRNSINTNGISLPFAVWEDDDGTIYAIDGHRRKEVLSTMDNVPKLLPAFFLDAKNRKEAVKLLLEVFNHHRNKVSSEVLLEWLEIENVDVEDIAIDTIDVGYVSNQDYSEKNKEIDTDDFEDKYTITLEYGEDDYGKVRSELSKKGVTPEAFLFDALGLNE